MKYIILSLVLISNIAKAQDGGIDCKEGVHKLNVKLINGIYTSKRSTEKILKVLNNTIDSNKKLAGLPLNEICANYTWNTSDENVRR